MESISKLCDGTKVTDMIFGIKLLNIRPTACNFLATVRYLYELTSLAGRTLLCPGVNAARQRPN